MDTETTYVVRSDELSSKWMSVYTVYGVSMSPSLMQGDMVCVKHTKDVSVGDVVVFRHKKRLFAHRLVKKKQVGNGTFMVTKGDNCSTVDPEIYLESLRGKVIAVIPSNKNGGLFETLPWNKKDSIFNTFNRTIAFFSLMQSHIYLILPKKGYKINNRMRTLLHLTTNPALAYIKLLEKIGNYSPEKKPRCLGKKNLVQTIYELSGKCPNRRGD